MLSETLRPLAVPRSIFLLRAALYDTSINKRILNQVPPQAEAFRSAPIEGGVYYCSSLQKTQEGKRYLCEWNISLEGSCKRANTLDRGQYAAVGKPNEADSHNPSAFHTNENTDNRRGERLYSQSSRF